MAIAMEDSGPGYHTMTNLPPESVETVRVSLAKLSLEPGDLVLLRCPEDSTPQLLAVMNIIVKETVGPDVRVLLLTDDFDISTISDDERLELIAQLLQA